MIVNRKCAEQDSIFSLSLLPIQWAYAIYLCNINGKAAFNLRLFFPLCLTCKLFDATIFQQNFATIKNPIKLQTDSIFQLQEELWWRYNKLKRKLQRKKKSTKTTVNATTRWKLYYADVNQEQQKKTFIFYFNRCKVIVSQLFGE